MRRMQVAIFAGGLATRLMPLASHKPKSMIMVQDRPFLEYQFGLLKQNNITDLVLCLGYLGEQIEDYFGDGKRFGMRINYSYEEEPLGTAGALKKAADLLDNPFFTMYGDSYIFLDFAVAMSFFQSQNKLALMSVYKNHNRYDKSNTTIEGSLVKKYSKQEKSEDMVYIDYGANIFRKEVLELIPEKEPYTLEDLFPKLINKDQLLAFEAKERFYEVGSFQGLKDFEDFARSNLR
jgi:NDP-sugar pyrophosphorylase family protein